MTSLACARLWMTKNSKVRIGLSSFRLSPVRYCLHYGEPRPRFSQTALFMGPRYGSTNHNSWEPGISFSRILTNEQRELFNQVNNLSVMSRSLAKQVGNVAVKEDSLLVDIARLKSQWHTQQEKLTGVMDHHEQVNGTTDSVALPSIFTVVFAGEYNAGKTTLINALLGNELLDTGVLPTTDSVTIVMANDSVDSSCNNDSLPAPESASIGLDCGFSTHTQLYLLPTKKFPILSDLCLIDTPGTNAILSLQHTSSTLRILHNADLIVFVTSADRPLSESEKQILKTYVKSYRKRVVMIINKMDVLERQRGEDHGDATKQRVEEYVVEHAGDLLGAHPVVIPLSARDALSAKLLYDSHVSNCRDEPLLWKRSNFGSLEQFLLKSLTSASKVRTKLLNPLGVSEGILIDCQNEIQHRQEELEVDVMTLRLLTSQMDAWTKEIQAEVIDKCRLEIRRAILGRSEVVRIILEDLSFFEQFKIGMGMDRGAFKRAWTSASRSTHVTSDSLKSELQSVANDCLETLSSRAQTQGNACIEYLGKRPAVIGGRNNGLSRMVGTVTTPKFRRLKDLQSSLTTALEESASDFPNNSQFADQVSASLRRTSQLSSCLVGCGFVPATLGLFGPVDFNTGMVVCGTLSMLGAASIPFGNWHFASSFEREWTKNTTGIEKRLLGFFQDSLHLVQTELYESVAPYSRYVKAEREWLKDLSEKIENGIVRACNLRKKINKACQ